MVMLMARWWLCWWCPAHFVVKFLILNFINFFPVFFRIPRDESLFRSCKTLLICLFRQFDPLLQVSIYLHFSTTTTKYGSWQKGWPFINYLRKLVSVLLSALVERFSDFRVSFKTWFTFAWLLTHLLYIKNLSFNLNIQCWSVYLSPFLHQTFSKYSKLVLCFRSLFGGLCVYLY